MIRFDFHSHILPGIDDGSRSVEESIQMLKIESEQGIGHVLATPHFYANADTPDNFLRRRRTAEQILREQMQKHTGLPQVSLGAEVHYFCGISESDRLLDLTFGNKSYILLEMPIGSWSDSMYKEIEQIYFKQGIMPVIAHIDRYIQPFRTYGILERLSEMPVLVQANAGFFLRFSTRSMALRMVKRNQIQLLGSDCHNTSSRPPNLGAVYKLIGRKLGEDSTGAICKFGADLLLGGVPTK